MLRLLTDTIPTDRLLLRQPRALDAAEIFAKYGQAPDVSKLMVWRPLSTPADAEPFIAKGIEDWAAGTRFACCMELESGTSGLIGMLDAQHINAHTIDIKKAQVMEMHQFIESESPEIDTWFLSKVDEAVERAWLQTA